MLLASSRFTFFTFLMAGSFTLCLIVLSILYISNGIYAAPQVSCYYIFGDSLADNGNNNMLPTRAKVNYMPYGIDFPDGPTGRFSNGRNMIDVIAELLGFETRIPPYATATVPDMLTGVNYASGAAGILDESGSQLGYRISLNGQLRHHRITISHINRLLGGKKLAANYLNKCLYTVGMGSNDFINNYFMPQYYPTSLLFTPEQFSDFLIYKYSQQLRTLYRYGARNVGLFGVGQIGCTPYAISTYGTNGSSCVESMNDAASVFNQKLQPLVDRLNSDLPDAKFTLLNQDISVDALVQLGLKVFASGCCNISSIGQCIPGSIACENRSEYVYWDGFHPTEIVNSEFGKLAYADIVASYIGARSEVI